MNEAAAMIQRAESRIASYGAARATVAFSGGVDSSVVLALAGRALGTESITAVIAVSPSLPSGELEAASGVAGQLGVRLRSITTREVEREAYARNDAMRCFHCKAELYTTLGRLATNQAVDEVVLAGANADDAGDFRPGLLAARELGVRNPLLEEGLTKGEVRTIARSLGLVSAEKPALACLSSRVAFGIRISTSLLRRIDAAERLVRSLGLEQVRVRHFGDVARVEVARDRVGWLAGHPEWPGTVAELRRLGWSDVQIDPEGYRTGSMNATLA